MVTLEKARSLILRLQGTEERVHWERPAFQANKRIFATMWPNQKMVVVKFSVGQQPVYIQLDAVIFSPAPGAWGRKGYTCVLLEKIKQSLFTEVIALEGKA